MTPGTDIFSFDEGWSSSSTQQHALAMDAIPVSAGMEDVANAYAFEEDVTSDDLRFFTHDTSLIRHFNGPMATAGSGAIPFRSSTSEEESLSSASTTVFEPFAEFRNAAPRRNCSWA